MLKSHEQFHSVNGKRQILVADDEMINREILREILKNEYDLIFACDGQETMDMAKQYKDTLSLILLDILMPVMSGIEVLKELRKYEDLSHIPVIVTTAEKDTEVESLKLGAVDFIPKPYPAIDVIHARILRTIELSEDRETIQSTEHDSLTGLYNKNHFYRYTEQYDKHHKDKDMDAVILDVSHFHMINERYGRAYGDEVLRMIGNQLKELAASSGGLACRLEGDTFMLYCPHREDYGAVMDRMIIRLTDEASSENRIRLRMGVYAVVDKSIDVERRFDRAKMAADTVKNNFAKTIGYYDEGMHQRELYAEQLIEDFPDAIKGKQFSVFYQPKFDVRPDTPVLTSAEALVRWNHPELGMISPGLFIPLFEDNGLIQQLDKYVWEETARQIRKWRDQLHYSIPVSVNVSRVDMYDPDIDNTLLSILKAQDLTPRDLMLEVTESAYTQDPEQIIETAARLRDLGFLIEMDDFGTGYSSLNMISSLPIDVMKLDMQFIRSAFKEGGNTNMIEVIIGIADYLKVPVIAEGVETEEQLHALKSLGIDMVQGYFFSRPVPHSEFEPFILQKKEADLAHQRIALEAQKELSESEEMVRQAKLGAIMNEPVQEEDAELLQAVAAEAEKEHSAVQLKTASIFFVILAIIASVVLLITDSAVAKGYKRMEAASDRYIAAQRAASDMEYGSDYLTDRVRCFAVTGEIEYLNDFIEEVEVTRRRDKAVESLEELLGDGANEQEAVSNLRTALDLSNELVRLENKAMRLVLENGGYDLSKVPEEILSIELTPEEKALSDEERKEAAESLVFDNNYMHYKDRIRENVNLCTQALINSSSQELESASAKLSLLMNLETILNIVFLMIVLAIIAMITLMIRKPLTNMVHKMQDQELIVPTGVEELRFVTRVYNHIMEENREARIRLSHEASHDALTGLFNRGAYDLLMESADTEHMALLLLDVDYFKSVNDTYGHAVGDRILKKVAEMLKSSFRSVDILCRIGGDEFAVVMTRVDSSLSQLVMNKIAKINDLMMHPKDDLPPVSLSVGVAFSDRENPEGDILHDADSALYRVKKAGRRGCAIFGGALEKHGK